MPLRQIKALLRREALAWRMFSGRPVLSKACLIVVFAMTAAASAAPFLSDGQSRAALTVLSRAGAEGLDPGSYRIPALPEVAPGDAALKAALLSYMRDLRAGRPGLKSLDLDVVLPPSDFDAAITLEDAVKQGTLTEMLANLPPVALGYAQLRSALARYRTMASAGGWPMVSEQTGPAALRTRLAFEDDIRGLSDTDALKRFQARHGLASDGVLGPKTLASLNIPVGARAETIAANMERWRWLPRAMEAERIVINVADAKLEMFVGGKSVLTSRVIVGRPSTRTPILRAEGAGITVNPPWTVPASIAAREILPKLKRNPAYLASQDMVLLNGPPGDSQGLRVNWHAISAGTFPYRIRQRPGPGNPLGRIKIELPNRFDVYLHDTPGKAAFDAGRRDVSHGCVRVEKILPLASYVLTADLSAAKKIANAIDTGATAYIPLDKKLPVYFLYWTAFVDRDGALEFRSDIYGRDQRMIAAGRAQRLASERESCSRG